MLLNELTDPYHASNSDLSLDEMVIAIKRDCGEMLRAYRQTRTLLFRGIYEAKEEVFVQGRVRPDRRPVMMRPEAHDLIEKAMQKIGLKATRKNSLFCTTNEVFTKKWGPPFILFVEDGWSATVFHDFNRGYGFGILAAAARTILNVDDNKYDPDEDVQVDRMVDELMSRMPEAMNSTKGLAEILTVKFDDIMITGNKYYGLRMHRDETNKVLERLELEHLDNYKVAPYF